MKLKKLIAQNFLSLRDIELELDERGLVLLCGENRDNPDFQSNGAGKSSITESLVYVLYGRTMRGIRGDDVVNNVAKKNCKVMLDIEDDDGTQYRISRFRKHSQQGNKFYLYCNGKDITPKSEADFTQTIVNLLQMDYLTFTSSIMYSSASFKFSSATDSELKSAFDTLLGFDIYKDCQNEAKAELRVVQSKIDEITSKIDNNKQEISNVDKETEDTLVKQKEFRNAIQDEINDLLDSIKENEEAIEKLNAEIFEVEESITELNEDISSIELLVDKSRKAMEKSQEISEELSTCKDLLAKYDKDLTKFESEISKIQSRIDSKKSMITRLDSKKLDLKAKIQKVTSSVGTPCPTCGQPLTEDSVSTTISELTAQITELDDEIEEYSDSITEFQEMISEIESNKESTVANKDDINSRIGELTTTYKKSSKLRDKYQELVQRLSELNKEKSTEDVKKEKLQGKVDLLKDRISRSKNTIDSKKSTENPYDSIVLKLQQKKQELQEVIEKYSIELEYQESERKLCDFWYKAYSNSGIKSLLLDDVTPYLNRQANKYLRRLSSDHMEIVFSTQSTLKSGEVREKFSVGVINSDGGSSYASNSSGEKKRVDIAINLALQSLVSSRSNKKLNLIILDEILDSLDDAGVEHIMSLLQEISNDKSSVFVISHNDSIKSVFTNTITVVKENGYSVLK
jgi:DNA repair exonuclease SbcCD ATPase subunit